MTDHKFGWQTADSLSSLVPIRKKGKSVKLLYVYDRNEDAFAILSHNLSDADVQEQLEEIRKEKVPVYALNQPRAHNTIDPDHCPSCAILVLRMLKQETDP